MTFKHVSPESINENAFQIIGYDDFLITAGKIDHFNTMTAGWGGLGFLWRKPVAYVFVRPQRYTYQFVEQYEYFTFCFFDKEYRDVLNHCGSVSGKEHDKIKETGLTPLITDSGNIYFEQSRLVFECRKIYYNDILPENFLDDSIQNNYPLNDYHRLYIGEIVNCLVK